MDRVIVIRAGSVMVIMGSGMSHIIFFAGPDSPKGLGRARRVPHRLRGLAEVGSGGCREPFLQATKDITLGLRAGTASACLQKSPRPARRVRPASAAPRRAMRLEELVGAVHLGGDGATADTAFHAPGACRRERQPPAYHALKLAPRSSSDNVVNVSVIVGKV